MSFDQSRNAKLGECAVGTCSGRFPDRKSSTWRQWGGEEAFNEERPPHLDGRWLESLSVMTPNTKYRLTRRVQLEPGGASSKDDLYPLNPSLPPLRSDDLLPLFTS
jgi:hypothetical protein